MADAGDPFGLEQTGSLRSIKAEMSTDPFPNWLAQLANALKPAKVVAVDTLRKWSLSQVFRITLDDRRTLIAKRGMPTRGPTELEIYQACLIPLAIDAPTIYASHAGDSEYIFLMEDLKGANLEQKPSRSSFLNAARKLADIRASKDRIEEISPSVLQKHLLTRDQLLLDLEYVLEHTGLAHQDMIQALRKTVGSLSKHINRLYQEFSLTLNHNDYHAKNLLHVAGRIVPIDWANASISPHMADLYCLIDEAKDRQIPRAEVIGAYESALQNMGVQEEVTDWYIDISGLCWSIHGLQWILEFGLDAIPASKDWVPNFLTDIWVLASRLDRQ